MGQAYMPQAESVEWGTPRALFDKWDSQYHFTLDVCASEENAKCSRFYTRADDGLKHDWTGEVCWMNPPYGRELKRWVAKACDQAQNCGATVVCLLPARTDTAWWHDYVLPYGEIHFIRGRLTFAGAPSSAPFPSVVVVFKRGANPIARVRYESDKRDGYA